MIRLFLASLVACTEPLSDYRLALVPHLLSDDVLEDQPDVKLILRFEDGSEEAHPLGTAGPGAALEAPNLPPLPAGTAVGLAIGTFNPSDPNGWSRPATRAYGEVVLEEDLGADGATPELDVLVMRVDEVTRLGKLGDAQRRVGGAAVMTSDRDVYIFGGGDPDAVDGYGFGVGRDTVLAVPPTVDGWGAGANLDEKLPSYDSGPFALGEVSALAGASAVYAETAAGPRIFVFGGRPSLFNVAGATARVLEFDPTTDRFVDSTIEMVYPRSSMLTVPVGANKVLLFGGIAGGGPPAAISYELFSYASRSSELSTHNTEILGNYGAYGAPLGNSAAICAGAFVEGPFLTPVDQCFVVGANDSFDLLPPLPQPLFGASIAALPGGALLVSGGTSQELDLNEGDERPLAAPASASAYRLDEGADEWVPVGDLVYARAHHRSVALADGRVLIVGGTEDAAILYAPTGPAVLTNEIFDPFTDRFEATGSNAAGSGQDPDVVGPAGGPWVVLEGGSEEARFAGGAAYGVIGALPAE